MSDIRPQTQYHELRASAERGSPKLLRGYIDYDEATHTYTWSAGTSVPQGRRATFARGNPGDPYEVILVDDISGETTARITEMRYPGDSTVYVRTQS